MLEDIHPMATESGNTPLVLVKLHSKLLKTLLQLSFYFYAKAVLQHVQEPAVTFCHANSKELPFQHVCHCRPAAFLH